MNEVLFHLSSSFRKLSTSRIAFVEWMCLFQTNLELSELRRRSLGNVVDDVPSTSPPHYDEEIDSTIGVSPRVSSLMLSLLF